MSSLGERSREGRHPYRPLVARPGRRRAFAFGASSLEVSFGTPTATSPWSSTSFTLGSSTARPPFLAPPSAGRAGQDLRRLPLPRATEKVVELVDGTLQRAARPVPEPP